MDRKPAFIRSIVAPAIGFLLVAMPVSAGTTYRWVDQNGNPVLSDRPPEAGIPYTEVGVDTGIRRYPKPVAPETVAPDDMATASSSTPTSQNSEKETSHTTLVVEAYPELCERARDNIFKLETFPRMRVRGDSGEVRFMSDEERAEQLATAYEVRDANCNAD